MALETLNFFAVFCKDQDSVVRVQIFIFSLLCDNLVFLSSIEQVYLNQVYLVLSQPQSSCPYSVTQIAEHLVLLPTSLTSHSLLELV